MARAVNRGVRMPVVLLFRHGAAATLAAVRRRPRKRDAERDVLQNITLVKDINCREPHRAHLDILADLALDRLTTGENVRDFDDLHAAWEKTLDIETLNRRFYDDLFGWFQRAVRECRFPDDGAGKGNAERHVIRAITRLLFIWFLVEKNLVPRRLFTSEFARETLKRYDANSTDYYRAVLQNLFFATLNTEIGKRKFRAANGNHRVFERYRYRDLLADPDGFAAQLRRVPFVNGGLFDCLDDFEPAKRGGRRVDAFTDHPGEGKALSVPARLFLDEAEGLFPLFRRYKFTVEENTPLDTEVALDPELLGRVFENLLAAYDPETEKSERKATGSYYTPRYIVDYMVEEALVAALAEKAQPTVRHNAAPWRERLRRLFRWEDAFDDSAGLFDENETEALVRAIARLRVLDPAVGSGAFPMGVLHKLTLALRRLDPGNERWEKIQKDIAVEKAGAAFEVSDPDARDSLLADISNFFEIYRRSDFGRKLYLIQNGIFGVDIQPVACQIAKLRFFISLAIEQTRNDDADDNYGFRPLPNLETRFVAANALIGLAHAGGVLRTSLLSKIERELAAVRERYFNARTRRTKTKARDEDVALRTEMAEELESADFGKDSARSIADWDPYNQNTSAEWFDPEWMFGISEGFDVTIGNPPYVRADFQSDKYKTMRKVIERSGYYETLSWKWDMYVPFIERGFKLLSPHGITSLIVSDAVCKAKYAQKPREWLLREGVIQRLDFYSNIEIFEAGVRNVSYVIQKADGATNLPLRRRHESVFGDVTYLPSGPQRDLDERIFRPEASYYRSLSTTVPLGRLCYISVGMNVHANKRVAPNAFGLKDVVVEIKDKTHPVPFVQGKHLQRWLPKLHRWLEWGTERAPALFSSQGFPEIFTSPEKILAPRSPGPIPKACYDSGQRRYDASSVGFVLWHTLQGVRNGSIKQKARYRDEPRTRKTSEREQLESASRKFSVKFLLAVMNSTIARKFLYDWRKSNIHVYPDDWKKLPVPDVPAEAQQPVVDIVESILATKRADANADVTEMEAEVDRLIGTLYGV